MPMLPAHRCATCGALVQGRCGACERRRPTAAHRGYCSARWRRVRLEQLRAQPFCSACGDVASDVDHVTPHRGVTDPLFWDRTNLNSLCHRCHSKKTATTDSSFARKGGAR